MVVARLTEARSAAGIRPVSRVTERLKLLLQALALPVSLIVIWEALGRVGALPTGIIPPPSTVLDAWYIWAFGADGFGLNPYSGTWFATILFSARRVLQGYAQAILLGVPLGIMIGWSALVARTVDPLIQSLRPIPITACYPSRSPCSASATSVRCF